MGQQLITSSPMLASIIDDCDAALAALHDGPAWTLKEELMKPAEESNINYSRYSQPACTAVQLMLVTYWINLGVLPSVVIGHSSGEVAASYAAGHLSLRDAIVVAYYRGLIMGSDGNTDKTRTGVKGAMVAVGLTQDECTLYLSMFHGQVSLAAINSPSSCTLSGDEPCIDHIITLCKQSGTFCRKLRVDMGNLSLREKFGNADFVNCSLPFPPHDPLGHKVREGIKRSRSILQSSATRVGLRNVLLCTREDAGSSRFDPGILG